MAVSEMRSLFNKLAAMGSSLDSDIQVAILLVSLSSEKSFSGPVSAIKTMDAVRSQKLAENADKKATSITAAAARKSKDCSSIRCFKCNKKGHIDRYCRSEKEPTSE